MGLPTNRTQRIGWVLYNSEVRAKRIPAGMPWRFFLDEMAELLSMKHLAPEASELDTPMGWAEYDWRTHHLDVFILPCEQSGLEWEIEEAVKGKLFLKVDSSAHVETEFHY